MLEILRLPDSSSDLISLARRSLTLAVPPQLVDDRFGESWAQTVSKGATVVGAWALGWGEPAGLILGLLDPAEHGRVTLEALVNPNSGAAPETILTELLAHTIAQPFAAKIQRVEMWAKPASSWHEPVAHAAGFLPSRTLYQMRIALPVEAENLPTRAFVPGSDEEALRLLNNAAFAGHPDQGNLSAAALAEKLTEPGVTPAGIRLHERDGRLVGFCWTKIHSPTAVGAKPGSDERLGEIYVIGLHPSVHGKGLGAPMTASGLAWLQDQGINTGMLYVEAENEAAVRTYERLGFETVSTDRAWASTPGGPKANQP